MDNSRRAVEAYWRSRMIDGVTADEDRVAPVYKLEEICELLRTSHVSVVNEVSEFILKRLDHKSPVVKQKALRLIKYAVGKSGSEFRRTMQRHSAAVRQLLHYKGQLDPLKGDALNKAVRDTAQETIAVLFASDDNKTATPAENISKRIEGFGNTNYEMPTEEKKSFLSEVMGIGSTSIIQGLTSLAVSHSMKKNDNGTYRSPNLRRSLTTEIDNQDRYEAVGEHHDEVWHSSKLSKNMGSGNWHPDSRSSYMNGAVNENDTANESNGSSHVGVKSQEERLLETVVTSGGVRLQPTRDALQAFLTEASKLDALAMSHAIEIKLQSHLWQVRMKAICILELILRKKDDDYCSIIASYFSENSDPVIKCCELPQTSLREKANKVLSLLDGDASHKVVNEGQTTDAKLRPGTVVELPDLIDTGDPDGDMAKTSTQNPGNQSFEDLTASPSVDLFAPAVLSDVSTSTNKKEEDDPFANVSFHMAEEKNHNDIFSGLIIEDKKSDEVMKMPAEIPAEFDIFGAHSGQSQNDDARNVHNLMAGLSVSQVNQQSELPSNGVFNSVLDSNAYYPVATMQLNMQPNIMFSPAFTTQSINYGAMGAFIAQQQMLFQNFGNSSRGYSSSDGILKDAGYTPPLPDIFQLSSNPIQTHSTVISTSKKEETKAFDFISEHLSSVRDSKRIH
ncbi:VHS domain-containing protein [Apostasia shenzhenica]|uniref:VHS domain-containing protein n=1 Tax=Apostasia shenzhenica TaxID=1088818 RepID=A0A2I0B0E1_9ASPA|nr:VHS domain-containing protein [Apostasia shenzhenica]